MKEGEIKKNIIEKYSDISPEAIAKLKEQWYNLFLGKANSKDSKIKVDIKIESKYISNK